MFVKPSLFFIPFDDMDNLLLDFFKLEVVGKLPVGCRLVEVDDSWRIGLEPWKSFEKGNEI